MGGKAVPPSPNLTSADEQRNQEEMKGLAADLMLPIPTRRLLPLALTPGPPSLPVLQGSWMGAPTHHFPVRW